MRLWESIQSRFERIDLRDHEEKILLLLALVVSASIGLIVVGFVAVTERMSDILLNASGWPRFLSPLAGSLLGGWLLFHFFPEARGSGIPQTRVAILLQDGVIRLRTVIGKFICSGISLGSGIALGREGPSVHIGAGIASVAGRALGLSPLQVRSLIPVGTAAAVAAAFNTPLAAVLFTLEEILADLHARLVGSVVIGAATSWIVLRLILGDEPLFHVPAYQLVHPVEFLIYALLGVAGGFVSVVFVKLLLWLRATFLKAPPAWRPFAPAAGGLTVALIALVVPGVLGVGYNLVSDALNGQMALRAMLLMLVLRIITTAACYGTGNAGGVFGPSLFIGAMLGGAVGDIAHSLFPTYTGNAGAYALVGMGAAFAGIIRTPMTSVIMIFEVTRDYTIIVPLMIANLCSYLLSQRLQRVPIYEALCMQEGILLPSHSHRLEPLTVAHAMRQDQSTPPPADAGTAPFVHADDPLDTALQRMGQSGLDKLPVLSRSGARPIGTLTLADAMDAYRSPAGRNTPAPRPLRHLPLVAALTVITVLLVSGLVFWQRERRVDRGAEHYQAAEELLARGLTGEAVAEFRAALAQTPQDMKARAALGLALIQTGNHLEAANYLRDVAQAEPLNAPVSVGLAEIARAAGNDAEALHLYQQAIGNDWPAGSERERTRAQLAYAKLLFEAGRRAEATTLLLTLLPQLGSDPDTAKEVAALIAENSSSTRTEEAYSTLAALFPADASIWLRLGDLRFGAEREPAAREAYVRAFEIDRTNKEAQAALARVDDELTLDPTRRGLPARERARRWDSVLRRVLTAVEPCEDARATKQVQPLLTQPAQSIEASDKKMEAALSIWRATEERCQTDVVVGHILAKLP